VPKGRPGAIDWDEPRRVAEAVATLGLKHAVVTSVNRDDDNVGGARIFAETIREIRELVPDCRVEVLIPDFQGLEAPLRIVLEAKPNVLNHNTESVPRLYRVVRSGARYQRTLDLLANAKKWDPEMVTKSGVMVGLGETTDELLEVFRDLGERGVDILTVGQYLRPSKDHLPMARFYAPAEFVYLKEEALKFGFNHVESGPRTLRRDRQPLIACSVSLAFSSLHFFRDQLVSKFEGCRQIACHCAALNSFFTNAGLYQGIPEQAAEKIQVRIRASLAAMPNVVRLQLPLQGPRFALRLMPRVNRWSTQKIYSGVSGIAIGGRGRPPHTHPHTRSLS
jgi:hypothetical protein